jgi:hypothetical protein
MRRTLIAVAILLLAAGPAAAYTIFLKDGSTLNAREKYRVVGDKAQITLPNGAQTELPLADIDVARTERGNASDFGSALIMEGPAAGPTPTPARQGPTLSDVAASRRAPTLPAARPALAGVGQAEDGQRESRQRTGTGDVDLMRVARVPLGRHDIGAQLGELLRAKGIERANLYDGTAPGRVLVDVTTNSEGAVFQALAADAEALLTLEASNPGAISELELYMSTDRRLRAGQFLLTPERARELVGKQVDVATFFLKYVQF